MSRIAYLGPKIEFDRAPSVVEPPPLGRVMPTFDLVDPTAEPIVVQATIPDYGDDVHPLREIHVFALPRDYQVGEPDALLGLSEVEAPQDRLDVTNVRGVVTLSLHGVPEGLRIMQPVLIAGGD